MFVLNFTTSTVNETQGEGSSLLWYIRGFSILPLYWLSVIPDIAYGVGVLANVLLATYLIKYKRYRSPIFALILSICFADTMMCAISIVWTTFTFPFMMGPAWLCPFSIEVLYSCIVCSQYHLVVISIVRFYQLVFPLTARAKVTSGLMFKLCIGVWLLSFTGSVPFAIFSAPISCEHRGRVHKVCSWIGGEHALHDQYLGIVYQLLPFGITAVFHVAKHCIVLKSGVISANSMAAEEQKRETINTRAVMIVITVYLVTATPVTVGFFQRVLSYIHPLHADLNDKLMFLNSTLNPFIYAFAARSVRRDVLRMFRRSM